MFLKNGFRPAYAGVTRAGKRQSLESSPYGSAFDHIAFSSSETDDFNSFSSRPASRPNQKKKPSNSNQPKKPNKKTVTLEISGKTLIKLAAIVVAVILLIVLAVSLIISSGKPKNILYQDNAFASYQALDGSYRISMNGKVLKDVFDSEVELIAASDNSFAYVCATKDGSKNVYILDGGKLDLICEGIDSVLMYSKLVPGVIYARENRVEYFFDEATTSLARNGESTPENFVISPDGTAVAFTMKNKNNTTVDDLYVYTIEQASPMPKSAGTASVIPVAISNGGEHLLVYLLSGETKDLYHVTNNERFRINDLMGSFNAVTATNAESTEIVFTTKNATEYHSYIYDFEELDKDANTASYLGSGYSVPQFTDSKVAYKATFKKSYFQNITTEVTFYVSKKYEYEAISAYLGQFSPDMKSFYFINKQKEALVKVDLESGNAESVSTAVTDFVITNKGNIYYIDDYGDLFFLRLSQERPISISRDVKNLAFFESANELYFEKAISTEEIAIYRTSEGSDYETFKFGKSELTELPTFTNGYSKKSYAYAFDKEKVNYQLYYTSTGGSFKLVDEASSITSEYLTDIEILIKDLLS